MGTNTWAKRIKHLYGLSEEDYNFIYAEQAGRCAVCDVHQLELKRSLVVDHCHALGYIRGLVCYKCNALLGVYDAGRLDTKHDYYKEVERYVKRNRPRTI